MNENKICQNENERKKSFFPLNATINTFYLNIFNCVSCMMNIWFNSFASNLQTLEIIRSSLTFDYIERFNKRSL